MKAVVELPDDLAKELEQHAQRNGRAPAEDVVRLVRLALLVDDVPIAELQRAVTIVRALRVGRSDARHEMPIAPSEVLISTDAVTGLPVIDSPPDALIRSMSNDQILAIIEKTQLEEDVDRAGIALRQ